MKFYALEYANSSILLVKSTHGIEDVLTRIVESYGIKHSSGTIYNPKSFLTLREVTSPDDRQQYVAHRLNDVLIG
jgi:hypothetical protein